MPEFSRSSVAYLPMTTYLFVTSNDFNPERVNRRAGASWSCSKTAKRGDRALVYVKGQGVTYEWRITSDAEPHKEWKFMCDVERLSQISPPITIADMCAAVSRAEWSPPHQNLRGLRSVKIPPEIANRIRLLGNGKVVAQPKTKSVTEKAPQGPNGRTAPVPFRGSEYRTPRFLAGQGNRDPFEVDPEKIERGNKGHIDTQNMLADFLRANRINPLSPGPGGPEFDLAWKRGKQVYVAEVKSITAENEEKQLRLGLGQVLRYRHAFSNGVVGVLVAERQPSDHSWEDLCKHLGLLITWPEAFSKVLG
jgi:hypothetical protein